MGSLLAQLRAAGVGCSLAETGRIRATGPLNDADRDLIRRERDRLVSELVAAGKYVPGSLDRIYGLDVDEWGLTPPLDPTMRVEFFTWDRARRARFNERAVSLEFDGLSRTEAEVMAYADDLEASHTRRF